MLWESFKRILRKTVKTDGPDQDIIFPESKGKVTKEEIQKQLKDVDDAIIKNLVVNGEPVTLIYLNSLVDTKSLQSFVLTPLEELEKQKDKKPEEFLRNANQLQEDELPKLLHEVMSGFSVLLFEKRNLILIINTFSGETRAVTTSESETTVLGPQDSFTESIETNVSLIKRRVRTPNLKTKVLLLGTETQNTVAVLYMGNIANQENIDRVMYRLKNIEVQGFIGLPVLQQMLEDKPFSPFPQFGMTVRPDNAIAALLDGRIGIFLNGSPEMAILPTSFFELFSSPEDFYNRWTTASLLRSIRLIGFFISILLTSTYVSVLTFHPEMLPPQLLIILAESRAQVPFPPVIEALIIELVIEVLREAGARMPTKIGQTIGIVGGIVIGTAAVEAGLASNILIVLVAISALLSFMPPNYLMSNSIRFVRYVFIIGAGMMGMFGQMLLLAYWFNHLLNLTSLGNPYMTPVWPRRWTDLLDSVVRAPITFFSVRRGMSRAKKQQTRPLDEE
ncbi:spore germination protein [Caldalkalibacillus mannanilyticus]|uniref:spore germination protein n=1 Tax=Caldalkalibacillus mannanilyticus TaxID=1418 RepID=UPI0009DDBBCB|nr:spore germination protein [Caldalkalibacillus mannanilyticus]